MMSLQAKRNGRGLKVTGENISDYGVFDAEMTRVAMRVGNGPRAHRKGLEALVDNAIAEKGLRFLPYNLATHGPAVGIAHAYHFPDEGHEMLAKYARMAGWLRRYADVSQGLPALKRVLTEGLSSRGMCSPRTEFDIWSFQAKYRTPELANRRVRAVVARDRFLARSLLHGVTDALVQLVASLHVEILHRLLPVTTNRLFHAVPRARGLGVG